MYLSPPTCAQGKTLTKSAPDLHAAVTSLGVSAPGRTATFSFAAKRTTSRYKSGAVKKLAPAPRQRRAVSVSKTVPRRPPSLDGVEQDGKSGRQLQALS